MKFLTVIMLALSASLYAQDSNIDCFNSPQGKGKPVYIIQPVGPYDAQLLRPVNSPLVVEQFEEESQEDPDFFNSGSCIRTAESNPLINFCGANVNNDTSLVPVAASNSQGGSRIVYCEQGISTYVYGVPAFRNENWRRQGPKP